MTENQRKIQKESAMFIALEENIGVAEPDFAKNAERDNEGNLTPQAIIKIFTDFAKGFSIFRHHRNCAQIMANELADMENITARKIQQCIMKNFTNEETASHINPTGGFMQRIRFVLSEMHSTNEMGIDDQHAHETKEEEKKYDDEKQDNAPDTNNKPGPQGL